MNIVMYRFFSCVFFFSPVGWQAQEDLRRFADGIKISLVSWEIDPYAAEDKQR